MAVLWLILNVYRQLSMLKDNWLFEFITCHALAFFFVSSNIPIPRLLKLVSCLEARGLHSVQSLSYVVFCFTSLSLYLAAIICRWHIDPSAFFVSLSPCYDSAPTLFIDECFPFPLGMFL
jgi:hypothetical protein